MSTDTPTSEHQSVDDLKASARCERRRLQDQSRAERRLLEAVERNDAAEVRLAGARAKLVKKEAAATESRAALDTALAVVAEARRARENGSVGRAAVSPDG